MRKSSARKSAPRHAARKPAKSSAKVNAKINGKANGSANGVKITASSIAQLAVKPLRPSPASTFGSALRSHKFHVGQTVSFTSSPITRPGASGSYKVVRLLPSDGDDYQYRIKNPGEAFERVAKESQLELEI